MAGHSKWANIQHRKRGQDAKRAKIFTKLIREITVAARMGGKDEKANPRLRDAIRKALSANMTRDTITKAVNRGAGDTGSDNFVNVTYEGYGPGGVAVMVECLTDNRNRTVSEVRHAFTKCGGNLGTDGSVAYLFNKKGLFVIAPDTADSDKVMEMAIDSGAEDVLLNEDHSIEIISTPDHFEVLRIALEEAGVAFSRGEITEIPETEISIQDIDQAKKMVQLLDMLEDLDDVQQVHSNADIPENILNQLD